MANLIVRNVDDAIANAPSSSSISEFTQNISNPELKVESAWQLSIDRMQKLFRCRSLMAIEYW